jgi:hypothetical protein
LKSFRSLLFCFFRAGHKRKGLPAALVRDVTPSWRSARLHGQQAISRSRVGQRAPGRDVQRGYVLLFTPALKPPRIRHRVALLPTTLFIYRRVDNDETTGP